MTVSVFDRKGTAVTAFPHAPAKTPIKTPAGTTGIDPRTLLHWLEDGGEIAFLDLREEGSFGEGHPLLAVNIPFSRLEFDIAALVPRADTRIVLLAGETVAARAASRLSALGYTGVHVLAGGVEAWSAAGLTLFPSVNVPGKAFAECVEHAYHTPDIEAAELDRLIRAGADLVILDSRTVEEFERFHVPGAVSAPGAEIVHRFADLVPSPDSLVVVSCAGRTRGIIGAQALINAGVPNRVVVLSGGTQGWRLAGFELERDTPLPPRPPVGPEAGETAQRRAADLARRFAVPVIDRAALERLRADPARTTYLFDVRPPAEHAGGHAEGVPSAQGGQLVQALDKWAATRGARIVLTDDDGVRATVTAHWLRQLGWDALVLPGLVSGTAPPAAHAVPAAPPLATVLSADEAGDRLRRGAALLFSDSSGDYRRAHPAGALWANRSHLGPPERFDRAAGVVVTGRDPVTAHLLALDLEEAGIPAAVLPGGEAAWTAAGLAVVPSPSEPADADRIDHLFWLHDRHSGNLEASRAYLDWELSLPEAVGTPEAAGFRIGPAAAR
ncbi:sulfurtransferase [Azospirillum palustre]|uniref:Sulfurtransferase n=1 Tax=Azospirillum palustre TaxID=2044885 RepID=A0A2B8BN22_9PROT|nr:rhodanese-like domain-containing protein [Azospirillum palustre]PGH58627.1 sulfurtransferase [Azospirillum palustre]